MEITAVHNTSIAPYSDFSLSSPKGRERRAQKQIDKARTDGAKERAKLGLEDGPPVLSQGGAETGKPKTALYIENGAAILVIVILIFVFKR